MRAHCLQPVRGPQALCVLPLVADGKYLGLCRPCGFCFPFFFLFLYLKLSKRFLAYSLKIQATGWVWPSLSGVSSSLVYRTYTVEHLRLCRSKEIGKWNILLATSVWFLFADVGVLSQHLPLRTLLPTRASQFAVLLTEFWHFKLGNSFAQVKWIFSSSFPALWHWVWNPGPQDTVPAL